MSLSNNQSAEERFRDAFARLRMGEPRVLPRGTLVSQNNVAREAECDPSALRKSRYPQLIFEIQAFVDTLKDETVISEKQQVQKQRQKNRAIRHAKIDSDRQRDMLASQLLCANAKILELSTKLADALVKLDRLRPSSELALFGQPKNGKNDDGNLSQSDLDCQ